MLIKNGVLIDKNNGFHLSRKDIRVEDGLIKEIADDLIPNENEEILDIGGLVAAPGFTDIHTHVYHGKTAIGIDTIINQKGKDVIEEVFPNHAKNLTHSLEVLSDEELNSLYDLLNKVYKAN